MTASRPTQVTQSEGEAERVGEKGGWAGQRKTEMQEGGGGDRKRQRRQRKRARETEKYNRTGEWEKNRSGRVVNSGGTSRVD